MNPARYSTFTIIGVFLLAASRCWAQPAVQSPPRTPPKPHPKYADPTRFEKHIAAFEAADAQQLPPPGAVLCTGSSTMLLWHDKIREDLEPLTVIPRGFGGSTMYDLLFYCDRVVIPYRPRAVVIYEGDNDVWQGVGAEAIRNTFRMLVARIHDQLPDTRIYMLAIKPSHRRREKWPVMQEANRLLAEECDRDKRLRFVDITAPLLDDQQQARRELFLEDDLHLNRQGYERLRDAVRPVLLEVELPFEKKKGKVPAEVGR